jgi:Zn-dependent protease
MNAGSIGSVHCRGNRTRLSARTGTLAGMPIGRRFKLVTIRGVPLYVGSSWVWMAALIVYLQYFRLTNETFPRPSDADAVWLAIVGAALFFGSILIHESAHAVVARSFDLPVAGITLVFWGGATETKANAKGPWPEFLISLVGPASTLAVAGGLWLLARATSGHLSASIQDLAWLNLYFAGINALPGFPLDGGRMLLAAAWGVTRNRSTALRVAGSVGIVVGMGMLAAAFISLSNDSGYWLFLGYIGFVMITTGRSTVARIALRQRLAVGTVADAMRPAPEAVPATISLSEALGRWLRDNPDRTFPVTDAGRVVGTVSMESSRKVGARDPLRPVRDGTVSLTQTPVVAPEDGLDDAVEWIGGRDALVLRDGTLAGAISPSDIERWYRSRWEPGYQSPLVSTSIPPRPDL